MREELIKAYDIIKEEQRNADNKANIFIVIISATIGFISNIPSSIYSNEELQGIQIFFLFLLVPLVLFVWSLVPIYNSRFIFKKKRDLENLNIFFWHTIYQYDTDLVFIEKYKDLYGIKDISKLDNDILKQIFVNASILENKAFTHKMAFYILGHVILIIVLGFIAEFLVGYNICIGVIFIITELIYTEKVFKITPLIISFFKNCKKNNNQIAKHD